MRFFRLCAAGVFFLLAAAAAQADERYVIDTEHTSTVFLVDHLGYSRMVGLFREFEGEFVLDHEDMAQGSVEVTIKTASVDTGHEERDAHLRSPDFFNTAEFPEMTYKSTRIESTGEDTYEVTGDLTLLGVTRPVTLDVTLNKVAPHPLPQYDGILTAGFSARGMLKRSDFGMQAFSPGIGDEIELWFEIEGHKQD